MLALLTSTALPSSTVSCAASAAALEPGLVGHSLPCSMSGCTEVLWSLVPSQRMAAHCSAALCIVAGLEGKSQVDPRLKDIRHGTQSVAGR